MKTVDGKIWQQMLISGANAIKNNSSHIDALNVFPVPDGDTGSNMSGTAISASNEIKKLNTTSIFEVSKKWSREMLLGARGNSGVILSQIFKGFSVAFKNKNEVNSFEIVNAFKEAKNFAYNSVMNPIEGTILTSIRETAEGLAKVVTPSFSIEKTFEHAIKIMRKSVDNTPNLLPVLKEVGVVDSGAEGAFVIFEGMLKALKGEPVKISNDVDSSRSMSLGLVDNEVFDGEFGYCTEFIIELKSKEHFHKDKFEKAISRFGNSLVVVTDDEIVKVHIHTKKPGNVFSFAQRFGEFIKLKSENMQLQVNDNKSTNNIQEQQVNSTGDIAVISVANGKGIVAEMKELGADIIINGGQTMNPSAKDFIDAINSLQANKIIILPNNSNIILASQQAAKTITNKEVIIIPTKTLMQGISALMNFDSTSELSINQELMNDAIAEVKTGQVTTASRTTKVKGVSVVKDQYLAIVDREIINSKKNAIDAACVAIKNMVEPTSEIVTIFYGESASKIGANEIASYIEINFDVDVEIKNGGQPVYDYIMAVE